MGDERTDMNKIYLIVFVGAMICGAYFYGVNITNVKCVAQNAQNNLIQNEKHQEQFLQNQRIIHETVYKTGLADIRRILRDEYTIAE